MWQTFGAIYTTRSAWAALVIPLIVIGGILGGVFTATEASVVTVLYVLLLAVANRALSLRGLWALTEESIGMFSLSLLCVAAASLWGTFMDAVPYGLCLLIAADLGEMSVGAATRAMVPFYLISLLVLAIAVLLPDLVLWIPRVAMANLMPSP